MSVDLVPWKVNAALRAMPAEAQLVPFDTGTLHGPDNASCYRTHRECPMCSAPVGVQCYGPSFVHFERCHPVST